MIQPDLAQKFINCELEAIPAPVRVWLPEDHYREVLKASIEKDAVRVIDKAFAEKFYQHCPINGATAAEYNYRIIQLNNDEFVMTSIRFMGLDVTKPFVMIDHSSMPIDSFEKAHHLWKEVRQHYHIFNPLYMRIFSTSDVFRIQDNQLIVQDFDVLAAPVKALQQLNKPKHYENVHLEVMCDLTNYEHYEAAFQHFYEQAPHLKHDVRMLDDEAMQWLIDNAHIFEVFINEQWAGVIAVEPNSHYFLSGYEVAEEILTPEFRGQGYAAAVQRHMIDRLKGEDDELLYGTIKPMNIASRKTAQRVGRMIVGGYYFITTLGEE